MDILKKTLTSKEWYSFKRWAIDNHFLTSPASTKFHLSVEGGLLKHSQNVRDRLKILNDKLGLGYSERTVNVVGMFHDLCKAGTYIRNILKSGEPAKSYTTWDEFPFGHGEKSALICRDLGIELTNEEMIAIRWHMTSEGGNKIFDIQRRFPLAFWIHVADMQATIDEDKAEKDDANDGITAET